MKLPRWLYKISKRRRVLEEKLNREKRLRRLELIENCITLYSEFIPLVVEPTNITNSLTFSIGDTLNNTVEIENKKLDEQEIVLYIIEIKTSFDVMDYIVYEPNADDFNEWLVKNIALGSLNPTSINSYWRFPHEQLTMNRKLWIDEAIN